MLSYLHRYHAGNHADVLKHALLIECIQYLQTKPGGFDYIDTHAGAGIYDLPVPNEQKTREIDDGALKLLKVAPDLLSRYRELVLPYLQKDCYPGSPSIAKQLLRSQDKAWLFELHPQVYPLLKASCEKRKQVFVRQEDGFLALRGLLPSQSKRALILIDPSYEVKTDYMTVVDVMHRAYMTMPNAVMLLWYPVVKQEYVNKLLRQIRLSSIRDVQRFELGVKDAALHSGMCASGMIVVNAPWCLADAFNAIGRTLSKALSDDGVSRYTHEILIRE